MEENKHIYTLHLTEKQAKILSYACDRMARLIEGQDWTYQELMEEAWDKVRAICGRYYMGQIEHIFMLRKGKDKPINDCGMSDLLSIPLQRDKDVNGNNIHDSQKPTKLFQVLVSMSSYNGGIDRKSVV